MTLKEMADAYTTDAERIRTRAQEIERRLETERFGKAESLRIKARAELLRSMYREMRATGNYIGRYYDGRERILNECR